MSLVINFMQSIFESYITPSIESDNFRPSGSTSIVPRDAKELNIRRVNLTYAERVIKTTPAFFMFKANVQSDWHISYSILFENDKTVNGFIKIIDSNYTNAMEQACYKAIYDYKQSKMASKIKYRK